MSSQKKIFTYEEAVSLLPRVRKITESAVREVEALLGSAEELDVASAVDPIYDEVVARWAESVINFGIEVKGLWLIDFDNGSGYYCWKYPEEGLQYFHGYEEGFGGRVKLN